jgi:hypothetical protein
MNKPEENIRYIAIASLIERKILVEYVPPIKREKISTVRKIK